MLFNAGAQAYASGQFDAAIQAFTEAQGILPRPAIVYSLAQAHRLGVAFQDHVARQDLHEGPPPKIASASS